MLAGRALVMTDLPTLAEIVSDERQGSCIHAGNIEKLADPIEELLNDKDRREELGGAASQWIVQNRTWTSVIQNVPELYLGLLR